MIVAESHLSDRMNRCERCDSFYDSMLIPDAQTGEHGERENLVGRGLRHRKISSRPAHRGVSGLKVNGHRVVNPCPDAAVSQTPLQLIAVRRANDIEVMDRVGPGRLIRD